MGLAHKVGQDRTEAGPTGTYWVSGAGSPGSEVTKSFPVSSTATPSGLYVPSVPGSDLSEQA